MALPDIAPDKHVLIAGPTASGKSSLALQIAETTGGTIVNADASQVFDCWRLITARPSPEEEARAPHQLYGHIPYNSQYSVGHWLRELKRLLESGERLIIVGGTGLYFTALTEGMADIPETPSAVRRAADRLSLPALLSDLDNETKNRIDLQNRARVQRAWEVFMSTGKSLVRWQQETPPPLLGRDKYTPLVLNSPKDWLEPRIRLRFQQMIDQGAVAEVKAMMDCYDPTLPSFRAIGVPELILYQKGELTLSEAIEKSVVSTRQYAKRQRTWFKARMKTWTLLKVD